MTNVMVLSLSGVAVKLLGMLFRIPLKWLIGTEGIGLFQLAYPVYAAVLTVSRGGFPVALSKVVAEEEARGSLEGARRALAVALLALAASGLAFSLVLGLAAFRLARLMGDPRAGLSILAIAPAVFFVGIMSSLRGYFQGLQYMVPTAIADFLEQVVRITTILSLAALLIHHGIDIASAGATFGAVTGAMAGTLYLLVQMRHVPGGLPPVSEWRQAWREGLPLFRRLVALGVPMTIGALALPLIAFVDAFLVQNRLQAIGYSVSQATTAYGRLSGLAGTLVNVPAAIASAIALSLVPAVSHAWARQDKGQLLRRIDVGLRIVLLMGVPASVGLAVLATPVMWLIWRDQAAGPVMQVVALSIVFLTLYQVTTAMLQGIGQPMTAVRHMLFAAVVKAGLTWVLTAVPAYNVRGAAFSTVLAFALAAGLNLATVIRVTGMRLRLWAWFGAPLTWSAAMIWPVLLVYHGLGGGSWATLGAVAAGGLLFSVFALMGGSLTPEDALSLPGGRLLTPVIGWGQEARRRGRLLLAPLPALRPPGRGE